MDVSESAQTYAGRPDEGLEAARQSKRLAPLDPHGFMVDAALMLSHLIRGEHEVVAEIGRRTTGLAPGFTANWKLSLVFIGPSTPHGAERRCPRFGTPAP